MKWGFSRDEIKEMPLAEYQEYVKYLNRYYKKKADASKTKNKSSNNGKPKPNPYIRK
ncbi:MAG: hypothetical protein ACOC1O_00970 [bacterium]